MNKKQNLLAIALSASFVLAGANVASANDQGTEIIEQEIVDKKIDQDIEALADEISNVREENPSEKANEESGDTKQAPTNEDKGQIVEPKEAVDAKAETKAQAVAYGSDVAPMADPVEVSDDESVPEQKAEDFNYAKDEEKVGNYRDTQLQQGNGPAFDSTESSMDMKDGFRYNTLEPSESSPDKKKWGIEIEIDKEKGQRTYTDFGFTNSGRLGSVLDNGNVTAKSPEEGKLAEGFKDPNYKANTNIEITGSTQKNLNTAASDENLKNLEEDLKHINKTDNKNTTMVWEGRYKIDNPNGLKATQGNSAYFNFAVNP